MRDIGLLFGKVIEEKAAPEWPNPKENPKRETAKTLEVDTILDLNVGSSLYAKTKDFNAAVAWCSNKSFEEHSPSTITADNIDGPKYALLAAFTEKGKRVLHS